FSGIFN
ncbi:hypothetical protein D039_1087B, partial [Vibrio parahaemolyticus EKP-028]